MGGFPCRSALEGLPVEARLSLAGTAMQRRRRSGVCVFQYLLVAEKGQLACSFVQCFHRQSAWKRGASKLCQHSASFQKFEVFPLHFFSNFFFLPLRLLVCLFDCPFSGKACKRGARSTLLGLQQALRQREQQQQRGTMRLRRRGGGSDARAFLGAAFCSLVRAFRQQQQLPCSPAA